MNINVNFCSPTYVHTTPGDGDKPITGAFRRYDARSPELPNRRDAVTMLYTAYRKVKIRFSRRAIRRSGHYGNMADLN